ncbi:MAG: putative metallopeptidase [Candidatus Pacearchaeota archaeon]|jgi:predicted metallopeptidase
MGIKYELAQDIQKEVNEIASLLFPHVKLDSVVCLRSFGSSSRGTIARCHTLGKAMQLALGRKGFYLIEVINPRFDKMSEIDKTKTLIHELMHIPKSFGGGFIHHNIVHAKNVEKEFQRYINLKKRQNSNVDLNRFVSELPKQEITRGREIEREFFVINKSAMDDPELVVKKKKWWF